MDDLISRQAAIMHFVKASENYECGMFSLAEVTHELWKIVSAQPEIIRCKDCKYWNSGSCEYPEHAVNCQDYYVGDIETEAEHFCGYAERREVTT